ncbi:hypothetical protein TWF970_010278 [Orbilia oligospora]|uniref:Uncharacterized protein n=1 Tax=Orbilia oligospora TaxID=2813651 RepID=A0A7C8VMH0_ORBOL|nr:hypothetical protein TWF970_010278 [Orbilia oligospora]
MKRTKSLPAFAFPGREIPHFLQPHKIHFPLSSDQQPKLLAHPDLRISIFTKSFLSNYVLDKPLPWIGSQIIRIPSDSLIPDTSQPENQYAILPVAVSSTPYLLPVLVVEDITRALTKAQIMDIIRYFHVDLNDVDGVLSTGTVNSLQSSLVSLGLVNKLPNFNWIENLEGTREIGIVIEVYTGKMDKKAVGAIYCGPGSIYNEAWKEGGTGKRELATTAVNGVKRAIAVIERAKTKHGYPVAFASISVNYVEVLEKLEGWDDEAATSRCKKRGVWKEILEMLQKAKDYGVRIDFCKSRKCRNDMIEGMAERRLRSKGAPRAENQNTAVVGSDSIDCALYPHSLENKPFAASSEMVITREAVLGALPSNFLDDTADTKQPEPRRTHRQRKRVRKEDEDLEEFPTALALEPLTNRQAILPGSRPLVGSPAESSERFSNTDENRRGRDIDSDYHRTLDHRFRDAKLKGGWCSGVERTFTNCSENAELSKLPNGDIKSEINTNALPNHEKISNMIYQDVAADLVDAREWKRALGSHLATGKPLRYPWATIIDRDSIEGVRNTIEPAEHDIENTQDPWSQFRRNIQAFREEFGYDMDEKHDEDFMDTSGDESDEDEKTGLRVPALYRSGGPSPESRSGIVTPPSYLGRDQEEPAVFIEDQMELKMPELDMDNSTACTIQPPVQVEPRGRVAFPRRAPAHSTSEYKGMQGEKWSLGELHAIDEIMGEIYDAQAENKHNNDSENGDASDEGVDKIFLPEDTYPRTRSRSRSLSRLGRRIGAVKLGVEAILEEDTVQLQPKGVSGSPGKPRGPGGSYAKASRSPVKHITRTPKSPAKGRGLRSPIKGLARTSGIGKPVDRNMAFKGLARKITDKYEFLKE